jgi:hypothetical protein
VWVSGGERTSARSARFKHGELLIALSVDELANCLEKIAFGLFKLGALKCPLLTDLL